MIAPLHNHTMYSALDGFSTPEEVAGRCVEIGCPCCGLTDHGVITGHLPFAKALDKVGIKPVFGCELYHGLIPDVKGQLDQAHLIALAMTTQGLQNLWRLVDATSDHKHFHNVGRVFWEDIEKHHEGIVFTSACALGLVPKSLLREDNGPLNRYLDILGDDFFIDIHTYPYDVPFRDRDIDFEFNMQVVNEALVGIATERGIPMVYANDAHYAYPWQYRYHDLYIALQTKQSTFTPVEERKMWHPPEALSIMDEATVRKSLAYLPERVVDEALANSVALGERASAELPGFERHLPAFIPGDCPWLSERQKISTPEELFIDMVEVGIAEKYDDPSPEVWDRVIYEVETLIRDGIHHYFLMGWDEMKAAQHFDIEVGPGRGSSAGSIVAYALGITDTDPLHYGLIFERFWNSGRAKGFPDIDSDFSRRAREKIISYLEERWGQGRVCAIGTTGYLKPKAVIDKLAKGCGIEYMEAEKLKEIVGRTTKIEILGHKQIGWNPELEPGKVYYVNNDVGHEIQKWINERADRRELRQHFVTMCEVCCSRVEQYGIHASGIAICDRELAPIAPAYRRGGKDGKPATMFAMEDIDKLGIIKLDVLGLRTLDVLEFWRQTMLDEHDIDIKWSGLDKQEHLAEMWDLLTDGFTAGIFQVEDGYGRQLCKRLAPRSVEDLSVINALNRPGPIQAGIPEMYIARKNGDEAVTYIHPSVEDVLGPILGVTYGLFVYQEQIIAFFNALGYSLSESDAMRKIMGKKQPQELDAIRDGVDEWAGKGYFQMTAAKSIPQDVAQSVWETVEGFADYCFNKSHTVAYAIIGFRTLFAKYYGPGQFFAANLRSLEMSGDGDKRKIMVPQYINECRRMDIEVKAPSIHNSRAYAYVDGAGALQFGYWDIKGIGNSGEYIELLLSEADDSVYQSADAFRAYFEIVNNQWNAWKKEQAQQGVVITDKSPKQRLQANKIDGLESVGVWPNEMSLTQRQTAEDQYLGVIITDNSHEVLQRNGEEIAGTDSWEELLWSFADKPDWQTGEGYEYFEYRVCGIVTGIQEKRAKASGKAWAKVTLEYGTDSVEFTVFASKWKTYRFLFKPRVVGIFLLRHVPAGDWPEAYQFVKGYVLH